MREYIIATLIRIFLLPLKLTWRVKTEIRHPVDANHLVAFWHNQQISVLYFYRKLLKLPCTALVSPHRDGSIIAKILEPNNMKTIRSSSGKNNITEIKHLLKVLKTENVFIAIDGPRGPIYKSKPGIVYFANKTRKPITFLGIRVSSYWQLKSWDKFVIPKPFATIKIYASEPIYLENINDLDYINTNMQKAEDSARQLL